ncbi:AMP-binding protein [Stutzerimonas stutzeri]|uniref:AMP-binding protein n=1 Tax=Stutzerimonas stutzeri TaxID=316 RepID=UPI00210AC24D|nr:AMP-binding protein [Stutzerimonas stutzeri]MCQ4322619.1 AMP-binding protein [Stutzerimonas stutzeri]
MSKEALLAATRLAMLARSFHGFVAMRFALARIGAVLVPVNFMLNADEMAYILQHSGAGGVVYRTGMAESARAAAAKGTAVGALYLATGGGGIDARGPDAVLF